jgi:hypothetical protein
MDMNSLEVPKREDRPIISEEQLSEESERGQGIVPITSIPSAKKSPGRPSTKSPGIVYKKAWFELPEETLRKLKIYQVQNNFATGSLALDHVINQLMK